MGKAPVLRVALQGADYNSIQSAVDAAQPGTEIVVENDTYTESIWIAKAKLTLRSASKHGAKIVAPQKKDAFGLGEDANYITLEGFDITAPGGTGIQTNQTGIKHVLNHHTIVKNCYIHDCGGGGIQLNHGDYRTVECNVVRRCALTGPWGQSGISFWQAIALDREPGFHIIVRGNILSDNSNPPNGTDGNGLIIDDFRNTQHGSTNGIYPNYTLVENNLAYHNGARGIHVFLSDHVVLRNNTAYHNNWDNTNDATWRGELSCINSSDVKWYNNIAVASSAVNADNTAMMDGGGNQGTEWTGNLFFDSDKPTVPSVKISGGANRDAVLASNLVATDPQFVAPGIDADADFRLKGSSPAIGTAVAASASTTDVLGRTRDNRPDIGAYEFGARQEEPKYLVFWSSPEKAGELAERIGMKGDGKTRLLGFGLPNATYELEAQLPSRIRSAFAAAREHDMALMLHFDFHLFWKNRPDLWNWFDPDKPGYNPNNKNNVEWHGWDGPPNKVRYLNHGVLERLPPNMCFTSKRMRAEVTRIVSKVIGPVLREEIAKLKAEGKEALFAGVLVGLEPSIDDYSQPNPERAKMMKEDGVPAGPLGYRALLDRGFRADNPPDDFRQALAKIVQETVAFWCEQFVDAGIPAEKLYPHVAAPAPIEVMNAPIWTAFNKYSRPGWTTYAVGVLGESFKAIYDELEKHGNPAWAGVEANAGIPGSVVDWETYLAWHYNHGCVLVGVNTGATGQDLPKRLWDSAFGKEAIAAYHKFLTGQPLVEKPFSIMDNPQYRIQAKMKRVRRDRALAPQRQGPLGGGQANGRRPAAGERRKAR